MGDEMIDACECIWSREMAMRRLLSLLRQSQSYCTDTECLEELPGPQPSQEAGSSFMMLAMCWVIFAMLMYFMRPNSLRRRDEGKPRDPGSSGGPPAPPPATLD